MPLRQFSATELVLTQRMRLERPLLLMVLLGAGGFSLAEGNVLYLLLTGAGVLVNVLAVGRRAEVYVPRAIVNAGVLAATGLFLVDFMSRDTILPALGHYLILIQLCKLFEQKRNRDYVQMIALSLVLMVAAAMTTAGLWFGLLLAAYVPVACYVGMVLTLKLELDRQAKAHLSVEARPIDPQRVAWNTSAAFPVRSLRTGAVAAAIMCLLAGVMTFLVAPRGQPGSFSPLQAGGGQRLTGFGNTVSLRELDPIYLDRRVVLRLRMEGPNGRLRTGPAYLRGRVYETYDNGAWYVSHNRLDRWRGAPWPKTGPAGATENVVVQDITMDTSLLPTLFGVAPVFRCDPPEGLHLVSMYPDMAVDRYVPGVPLRYTVRSWLHPIEPWQRDELRRLRDGASEPVAADLRPSGPPALAAQARQWAGELLDRRDAATGGDQRDRLNRAIADRLAAALADRCRYTLDLEPVPPGADPVEDFLFRTRAGHCELFASAAVLMCRSVGVPARLATGFLVDEDTAEGEYIARASDAHAWCEVYAPSADWQVIEATPPGSVFGHGHGSFSRVRRWWDSAAFLWRSHVIGYGEQHRRRLFGPAIEWVERAGRRATAFVFDAAAALWDLIVHGQVKPDLVKAVWVVAGGAGLVVGTFLLRRTVRRWLRLVKGRRYLSELPDYYRVLLAELRRRGLVKRPDQTDREFLAAASTALAVRFDREVAAEPPGPMEAVGELLYRTRWGGVQPSPEELAQARRTVADILRALGDRSRKGPSSNLRAIP